MNATEEIQVAEGHGNNAKVRKATPKSVVGTKDAKHAIQACCNKFQRSVVAIIKKQQKPKRQSRRPGNSSRSATVGPRRAAQKAGSVLEADTSAGGERLAVEAIDTEKP